MTPKEQTAFLRQMIDELSDILLVLDMEKKKIMAVKGVDEAGNLQTVTPNTKNESQFMRVDKSGDLFSNFFSNFLRQLKNPTKFKFFKVPGSHAIDTAKQMQQHLQVPNKTGENLMAKHEVTDKKVSSLQNQNTMETTQSAPENAEYRYKPEQIDWETMSNLGLSKERLEKLNLLDPLLKGYKTNELVPISLNLGTAVTRMDARLSLQQNEAGQVVVAIHGIRKEPQLNVPFFGHEFTQEDKDNLKRTGNMGRVVDLVNPKNQEIIPSIISIDRLTNEIVALRTDKMKIPDEIKGIKLDPEQKQALQQGQPLHLEGMISKKGEPFKASVQFNADKRYVEFIFDRDSRQKLPLTNQAEKNLEAPEQFRGKELDDNQYQKLKDGKTVYVDGLVGKEGKSYSGYIKFNKETGNTEFSFTNPDKMKEQIQPKEKDNKATATTTQDKSNSATKNTKDLSKADKKETKAKQQKEPQKEPITPAKSQGRKR